MSERVVHLVHLGIDEMKLEHVLPRLNVSGLDATVFIHGAVSNTGVLYRLDTRPGWPIEVPVYMGPRHHAENTMRERSEVVDHELVEISVKNLAVYAWAKGVSCHFIDFDVGAFVDFGNHDFRRRVMAVGDTVCLELLEGCLQRAAYWVGFSAQSLPPADDRPFSFWDNVPVYDRGDQARFEFDADAPAVGS